MAEGTSIISAASKAGKSWFVLDMGLKIAAGKSFFNKQTKQAGVLYLALEDTKKRLQDRMNKVLNGNPPPELFYFATRAPTLENGLLEVFKNHMKEHPETKLIIIDTLQKIRASASHREGTYQQDYREMGQVKEFMDEQGVSVLFVHHNRKMKDNDDPYNMISTKIIIMMIHQMTYINMTIIIKSKLQIQMLIPSHPQNRLLLSILYIKQNLVKLRFLDWLSGTITPYRHLITNYHLLYCVNFSMLCSTN